MNSERRVILIVMDSVGAGAMPDAARYGDEGASTLNHIAQRVPAMRLPNLCRMGLSSIEGIRLPGPCAEVCGAYGRAALKSAGKDTITGHWEIAGLITETPFCTFTETGFPETFIRAFEHAIGTKVLGNVSASGTEIIKEYGELHKKTGFPIVYTSADSVFQIAADVSVIPLQRLYEICRIARGMLQGDLLVGRVIARPFYEKDGVYVRISDRMDFAVDPFGKTILDEIKEDGQEVCAIGKIYDIFNGRGITSRVHTADNREGIEQTLKCMRSVKQGLIFTNLVDFDAVYGHRRDPAGYAAALEELDRRILEVCDCLGEEDLLMICADHGNDPVHTGWNHTREYVPVLVYSKKLCGDICLGTLDSLADIGATAVDFLGIGSSGPGRSFLSRIEALQNGGWRVW